MSARSHKISKVKGSYVQQVEHVSLNLNRALLVTHETTSLMSFVFMDLCELFQAPWSWQLLASIRNMALVLHKLLICSLQGWANWSLYLFMVLRGEDVRWPYNSELVCSGAAAGTVLDVYVMSYDFAKAVSAVG